METKELFNIKSLMNEAALDRAYATKPHLFAIGRDCDKGYDSITLKLANERWGELYKGRRYDDN